MQEVRAPAQVIRLTPYHAEIYALAVQDSDGANLDVAMAQHLLVAADRFQLPRLRGICERRLCETVRPSLALEAYQQRTNMLLLAAAVACQQSNQTSVSLALCCCCLPAKQSTTRTPFCIHTPTHWKTAS